MNPRSIASIEFTKIQLKTANVYLKNTSNIMNSISAFSDLKNYINKALADMQGPTFNAESNFNTQNNPQDASADIKEQIRDSVIACKYKMYDYIEPKDHLNYQEINSINANLSSARAFYDSLIENMTVFYEDLSKAYTFILDTFTSISKLDYETQFRIMRKI